MDAQRVVRGHLDVAARPLLRTFVQAVYAYAGLASAQDPAAGGGKGAVAAAAVMGSLGPEYRTPYLEEQVVRLKSIRTLLLAMEVRPGGGGSMYGGTDGGRERRGGGMLYLWGTDSMESLQDGMHLADYNLLDSCPLPLVGSPGRNAGTGPPLT